MNYQKLGFNSYCDYLKSDLWTATKERFWASKRPKHCLVCRNPHFDLHHINYSRLGKEHLLKDLIPLCRDCHYKIHTYHKKERLDLKIVTKSLRDVFGLTDKQVRKILKDNSYTVIYKKSNKSIKRAEKSHKWLKKLKENNVTNIILNRKILKILASTNGGYNKRQMEFLGAKNAPNWFKDLRGKVISINAVEKILEAGGHFANLTEKN